MKGRGPTVEVSSLIRAAVLCVAGLLFHPTGRFLLDGTVSSAWSVIHASPVTNHPLSEAVVATLGFWWSACLFESLHKIFPWVQRFRLEEEHPSDVPPLIESPLFFATTKIGASAVYLFAVYLYHLVKFKPPLPLSPPSAQRLVAEVALGVVLYDLCFMPLHWLMHNGPYCLRRVHRAHHEAKGVLRSGATVRHSLIDGALQVVCNILVQFVSPWGTKHPLSRFLHNLVVTYLLSEAHSGYDLPWMSHRVFPGIFGGAPRHNAHHNLSHCYYQQFFCYIDDLIGATEKSTRRSQDKAK